MSRLFSRFERGDFFVDLTELFLAEHRRTYSGHFPFCPVSPNNISSTAVTTHITQLCRETDLVLFSASLTAKVKMKFAILFSKKSSIWFPFPSW
jgi:hypothetical protein